jgi:hypothetical protein
MSDTPARPEQPANLIVLHRELVKLASQAKPSAHSPDRLQPAVLVIRGR